MGKSASSSLQHVFLHNRDELLRQGISYPSFGGHPFNHNDLNQVMVDKNEQKTLRRYVGQLDQALRDSQVESILLSYEGWAHSTRAPLLFKRLAEALNVEIRIILIVRQPEDYLNSWYSHRVMDLKETSLFPPVFRRNIYGTAANYDELFRQWESLGGSSIIVLPMRRTGEIVAETLKALSLDYSRIDTNVRHNVAQNNFVVEIHRRLAKRRKWNPFAKRPVEKHYLVPLIRDL